VDNYIAILRKHLPEIRKRYGVRSLGIFGSFVRGEQQTRSDLDVLVEFDRAPTLFGFIDLGDYLTDLLGVKVDLVMKSALKPAIGSFILAEVVPV
jgi:predicted nucleotidyltransferase